jgi:uncharacterized protein YciW
MGPFSQEYTSISSGQSRATISNRISYVYDSQATQRHYRYSILEQSGNRDGKTAGITPPDAGLRST